VDRILGALEAADDGLNVREIERAVNLRPSQIEKVLKLLVVEPQSPVLRVDGKWARTPHPFAMDRDRIRHLTRQREAEWEQMGVPGASCSMQFLAEAWTMPMRQLRVLRGLLGRRCQRGGRQTLITFHSAARCCWAKKRGTKVH
jgi:hypothetical protein